MNNTTTRTVVLALVALVALATLAGIPAAMAQEPPEDATDPGERLAGVVAVGDAELEGEVRERTYGLQIAQAATDDAKADVVSQQLAENEQRIGDLEDRHQTLIEQREAGEIREGQFRAEAARIAAERGTEARLANHSAAYAGDLPKELREEREINVTAIQELATRANELGGEEVAEIARNIAGERVSTGVGQDRAPGDIQMPPVETNGVPEPPAGPDSDAEEGDNGNTTTGASHDNGATHDDANTDTNEETTPAVVIQP